MKRYILAMLSALLMMIMLLPSSPAARAEEFTCRGALGGVTVDNLRVPQGATCRLTGTRIQGTLKVENNATLVAKRINVIGNIQAEGAAAVNVTNNSTVGGSIQIKQGRAAKIDTVRVNGDIQFDANSRALSATRNTVGGSIQAFQNRGGVTIANNRVNGNLQCKENRPAPTGGNNQVQGSKEDQCARL